MGFTQQFQPQSSLKSQMAQLKSLMQGDTSAAVSGLLQSNPRFAQFVAQNQGKSISEAFKSYGYDLNEVMSLINS